MGTEDGTMGLNEVALGIPVPLYWIMRMKEVIGHRETERMLLGALMPKSAELLKIGMVDHVVPVTKNLEADRATLLAYCTKAAKQYCLNYPPDGFSTTKSITRQSLFDAWSVGGPTDEAATVWKNISDEKCVAALT